MLLSDLRIVRFAFDPDSLPGLPPQARIRVPASVVQAGVALRVVL